ncbi:glycosyltransferase [Nocardioides sp. MH1]|uniref:glycosyltransferase n=1 Tax=Nocardioides sp. MH1 TaxID=3242490 RepID=UPI00352244C5
MRIQTVIAELGAGGAEAVALTIAAGAASAGDDVLLASTPGYRVERLRASGVDHLALRLAGRNPVDLARSVGRLRAVPAPDVVHTHNPKATLVARAAFGRDVPLVATLHGVPRSERRAAARILRWAADRVVVVAPHLADQLVAAGFPAGRVEVVPNAVEPLPPYDRRRARDELGLPADAVVGLCLARMVEQKRHDLLLDAWARLGARTRPAHLLLAGDGPTRPRIAARVARPDGHAPVHLLGERSDVARLVAASDFLVLPTDWEGLPVSVLEAMAAGLPVIGSRVGGLAELHDAVRLVDPGSAPALVEALTDVVGSSAVRAELAARGRALTATRFGADAMVARYRAIYAELAGTPGRLLTTTGGAR